MEQSSAKLVVEVDVREAGEAADLVRELELREVEAAKAVDRENVVRIAVDTTDDGLPVPLVSLVAIEEWLAGCGGDAAAVRFEGESHVVRPRDHSSRESWSVRR